MTTNKTPIQELIDWISEIENSIFGLNCARIELDMLAQFKLKLKEYTQKEKAFAFYCFEAGNTHGMDVAMSLEWGDYPTKPDFNEFYSQYVEQHP